MKHLLAVASACLGVAVVILLISYTSYFSQLNLSAFDFTLRVAGEITPSSPTTIVAIDEESLARVGPWQWSREKIAEIINQIQAGNPRSIAVDLLLDDASSDPAKDDALAAAISHAPNIVLATRIAADTDSPQWLKPNAKFLQPHVRLGHVHAEPDLDGISRHVSSSKLLGGIWYPAFSMQALGMDEKHPETGVTIIRSRPVMIRFVGGRHTFPYVSASQVLEGRIAPSEFKDRIVLIGLTAEGMQDQWFTPFSTADGHKMSGVEIHANAIETFYASRVIEDASVEAMIGGLFALVILLWWLDRRFEGWRFYTLAILMLPGTVAISWALLKYNNTWLAFPPFWAAIVLVVPGLEVLEIMRVNRDLDRKIARLSGWTSTNASYAETEARVAERKHFIEAAERNARWRLQAVDLLNEDLVRFLSFNNAILANIEDVIIVADPSGRVVYQNPAARRLPAYSESPAAAPEYLKVLLDGRSLEVATEFVPSSDGKRYFNVTFSPIAQIGMVISLHDTTAQFELNQAKNDMVSLVSHELRTPLTSIRGYSDMLVKYNLVADKGKGYLETIIDESRRLNNLIQSFLDIAYIESGRQKINITEFEVQPVLRDMLGILGPVAAEKQIQIDTPSHLTDVRVRGDRLLLYQAISNLVTNAIKYSPSGTTVRLNVSNGHGRVRFEVADQGFGIPAEDAAKVFEKFYRRGNKETREQSGFGLGLAFVKEVAVKHGGDVVVESEVGKGSVFTLWIPQN